MSAVEHQNKNISFFQQPKKCVSTWNEKVYRGSSLRSGYSDFGIVGASKRGHLTIQRNTRGARRVKLHGTTSISGK
jgi:hypothetical protein